ncbi:MAG: SIR2 family protein [Planctomycetes bacterium]|nr:SIR2 family protein [Planctomycetota bacterium]
MTEPVRAHLDIIADRLWGGHAAVMVGAGFSLNAIPLSGSARMPSWQELARALHARLYSDTKDSFRSMDTLRLADEYSGAFGAASLDRLVKDVIRDEEFRPSDLHARLLELPWAEVFTTNYDTLLERAAQGVISRRYDVVVDCRDLPFSSRPRIVKLHGSLPKSTPFILSGEQYRTYPTEYAPFVNTVQQSVMENLLCLVGFSGDDPNFERWTGWVRDNLSESMPYIYLIGLPDLTDPWKKVLTDRRIIPVDLSSCDGVSKHPDALSFFLDYMEQKRPKPPGEWSPRTDLQVSTGKAQPKDLLAVLRAWQTQHQAYPGWIVPPHNQRGVLWRDAEGWAYYFMQSSLTPPNDLLAAYELDWRLRCCLVHPVLEVHHWIEKVVKRYNPFPAQLPELQSEFSPTQTAGPVLEWEHLPRPWVELVFSAAKTCRIQLQREQFDYWMGRVLKPEVLVESPEWFARWYYEKCMYHVAELDFDGLRSTVEEWPTMQDLPFHEMRKGTLMLELGDFERAERVVQDALNELRRRANLRTITYDVTTASQESLAMLILRLIRDSKSHRASSNQSYVRSEEERRKNLERYDCDPLGELNAIATDLKIALSEHREPVEHRRTFDGPISTSWQMFASFPRGLSHALEHVNIFEEGGLPYNCRHFTLAHKDSVRDAAGMLRSDMPFWALTALIRAGETDALESWFSRTFVAGMKSEELSDALLWQMGALRRSMEALPPSREGIIDGTLSTKSCQVVSEIISRLSIRCPASLQGQVLDLAVQMRNASDDVIWFVFRESVSHMFHRLIQSMSPQDLLNCMPTLLSLPVLDSPNEVIERDRGEPFNSIMWPHGFRLPPGFQRSSWQAPISHLIHLIDAGTPQQRRVACIRLTVLYDIGALEPDEQDRFRDALWNEKWIDESTGLPLDTGLFDSGLLTLPCPAELDVMDRVKAKLLRTDFPLETGKSVTLTRGHVEYMEELLRSTKGLFVLDNNDRSYVHWTIEEVSHIFDKLVVWWDSGKDRLLERDSPFSSTRDEFLARFKRIPSLLIRLILIGRGRDAAGNVDTRITRLIDELSTSGIPCLQAKATALIAVSQNADCVLSLVSQALASSDEDIVEDACGAVAAWSKLAATDQMPPLPSDLPNGLFDIILFRHIPGLRSALLYTRIMVAHGLLASVPDAIVRGLAHLQNDTSLSYDNSTIPTEDRPEYRRLAAELAYTVYTHCSKTNIPIPPIILDWRVIAADNPLPEVRKAWPQDDNRTASG